MNGTENGVKKPKPSLPPDLTDRTQLDSQSGCSDDIGNDKEKQNQRDKAIGIGMRHTLSHDGLGNGYATITTGDLVEHYQIRSRMYKNHLTGLYFEIYEKGLSKQAISEAQDTLEAKAIRRGNLIKPALRAARVDQTVEIDLCNDEGQIVIVTGNDWRVAGSYQSKAFFPRRHGQLPLTPPVRVEDALKKFFALYGIADTKAQILVASWLLSCIIVGTPTPILILNGGQGTGKTALAQALVRLIDPQSPELSTLPTDERDLCISARTALVLGFDNVSRLTAEMSDAFCRLATGGGIKNRKLFTDDEQVSFSGIRAVVFNGIPDVVHADDLRERSIVITLEPIAKKNRKKLEWIEQQFYAQAPEVLGCLLDGVSAVLKATDNEPPAELERMADFAVLAQAGMPALGFTAEDFATAYSENLAASLENVLDSNLVAQLIRAMPHNFEGTYTDLLKRLREQADSWEWKDLPRSPRQLGNVVRRLQPGLATVGISVSHRHSNGHRIVNIDNGHI
jgi:hypothetical protein